MGPRTALVVGLALCYASLLTLLLGVIAPPRPRVPLARRTGSVVAEGHGGLAGLAERAALLAESGLRRRPWGARLAVALDRAGVALRPQDFVVLVTGGSLAGAAVGLLLAGVLLAVPLAVAGPLAARVFLSWKAGRRQAAFADQLDDTLQLLAGSLRAGHSLLQALDAVAGEAEAPTAEEFRRTVNATRVGRDLGDALGDVVERTGSEDFSWVAQAVAIHREVGGDLADVLDNVGDTIRERTQIRRQVKTLSAEGKLSALVLMGLPIGILAFLSVTNPAYLAKFTSGLAGWAMLATAATLMTGGGLWLRKLVNISF